MALIHWCVLMENNFFSLPKDHIYINKVENDILR